MGCPRREQEINKRQTFIVSCAWENEFTMCIAKFSNDGFFERTL